MSKYMKVLQIFYNDVEYFIFLYKLSLVFGTYHSLHVDGSNNPQRCLWDLSEKSRLRLGGRGVSSSLVGSWRKRAVWRKDAGGPGSLGPLRGEKKRWSPRAGAGEAIMHRVLESVLLPCSRWEGWGDTGSELTSCWGQ